MKVKTCETPDICEYGKCEHFDIEHDRETHIHFQYGARTYCKKYKSYISDIITRDQHDWDRALKELFFTKDHGKEYYPEYFVDSAVKYLTERYQSGERSQELFDLMKGNYSNG